MPRRPALKAPDQVRSTSVRPTGIMSPMDRRMVSLAAKESTFPSSAVPPTVTVARVTSRPAAWTAIEAVSRSIERAMRILPPKVPLSRSRERNAS